MDNSGSVKNERYEKAGAKNREHGAQVALSFRFFADLIDLFTRPRAARNEPTATAQVGSPSLNLAVEDRSNVSGVTSPLSKVVGLVSDSKEVMTKTLAGL